ncbi:hypothetical protein ACFLSV_01625 [Bacteroidota bacterium]
MAIETNKYNLPDIEILANKNSSTSFYVWIPDKTYLILGRSNNLESSLIQNRLKKDSIKVFKRPSGGETVALTPNTLVISAVIISEELKNTRKYFRIYNQRIIDVLEKQGIDNLSHKGISDIALNNKKVLGSAIYRTKGKLFYHSVLNVSEPVSTIEKYIKHPNREPDYRNGRKHSEFVTSLSAEGFKKNITKLKNSLEKIVF